MRPRITPGEILSEARQLPLDLRAELLDPLGAAMHGETSREIAEEWNCTALDRLAAVDEGRSRTHPGGVNVSADEALECGPRCRFPRRAAPKSRRSPAPD